MSCAGASVLGGAPMSAIDQLVDLLALTHETAPGSVPSREIAQHAAPAHQAGRHREHLQHAAVQCSAAAAVLLAEDAPQDDPERQRAQRVDGVGRTSSSGHDRTSRSRPGDHLGVACTTCRRKAGEIALRHSCAPLPPQHEGALTEERRRHRGARAGVQNVGWRSEDRPYVAADLREIPVVAYRRVNGEAVTVDARGTTRGKRGDQPAGQCLQRGR